MQLQMHQLFVMHVALKRDVADVRADFYTLGWEKFARAQKQLGKGRFISKPAVTIG